MIKVSPKGEIEIAAAPAGGVSQEVVSELMITANHLSAVFLKDRGIPAVFRSQTEKISEEARELDDKDPLFPVRIVRMLKPSRIMTYPEPHGSLGVDCYAQATSPIRRYTDLIVQRQIYV